MIEDIVHVLCFENGAEYSLISPVGPSWVVLDSALAAFIDLDWFRATFIRPSSEAHLLAYPRAGFEGRYWILGREDVARVAAGLRPFLEDPIAVEIATRLETLARELPRPVLALPQTVRATAEGLARLATKVLSAEDLALAHTSLL